MQLNILGNNSDSIDLSACRRPKKSFQAEMSSFLLVLLSSPFHFCLDLNFYFSIYSINAETKWPWKIGIDQRVLQLTSYRVNLARIFETRYTESKKQR